MTPERMAELLRDHPEAIAKFAREHLEMADTLYHEVLNGIDDDATIALTEQYFAAVVAAAITILTEAPDAGARLRVQSTANLLLQTHGVPVNDTEIRKQAAESAKDFDPDDVHRVVHMILDPDFEG